MSRLVTFNELPRDNKAEFGPRCKAQRMCTSGNEMPAVVKMGVRALVGEHLTEKYNSEVISPVKSQLQSVTIMHHNDWGGCV